MLSSNMITIVVNFVRQTLKYLVQMLPVLWFLDGTVRACYAKWWHSILKGWLTTVDVIERWRNLCGYHFKL